MESKICLIVPYFGRFPSTFQFWLQSCKNNPEINWLIFTDDKSQYDYPSNIKVVYTTLENLRDKFEKKLGFSVSLEKPYKLCDFKPLYGDLFEDRLMGLTHWGYCDTDLVFGKFSNFISDTMLYQYDKISVLGHLSIYKNNAKTNKIYKKCDYKSILQNPNSCIFDEVRFYPNINDIMLENGCRVLKTLPYADIGSRHYNFYLAQYISGSKTNICSLEPTIYHYKDGQIFKVSLRNKKIVYEEIIYVHFQKREIKVCIPNDSESYILIPNRVVPFQEIDVKYLQMHSKDNLLYFAARSLKRIWRAIKARIK